MRTLTVWTILAVSKVDSVATVLGSSGAALATAALSSPRPNPLISGFSKPNLLQAHATRAQSARIAMGNSNGADFSLHGGSLSPLTPISNQPINLQGWDELTSVTESEDCYAELSKQIKDQLDKLDKLRKLDSVQKSATKTIKAASQTQASSDDESEFGGDTGKEMPMREIIGSQLKHMDRLMVDKECKHYDMFEQPPPSNAAGESGPFSWLPVDPAQVDYVYTTLKNYKQMLDTFIEEIETSMGKSVGEILAHSKDEQGNLRVDFTLDAFDKFRAGLLKGAMKVAIGNTKFKIKTHLQQMIGNFFTNRTSAPSSGSLGIFGPIIEMIGGTDARMAARYLLDPVFRNSLDTINRDEPMDFLKCLDEDKIKEPQC